ncbi:hypothetical protein RHGRI_019846 [Rhododendron griersonianum]|uniref:C-terminal associated domain-containing protein n=1 Tax=Rhododendron griersonianum TaxID=479676 RepID=A0AAV6JE90_9ERIC|nr:hypothetical protein RHGRI_019846 [Rhododendron griersonianum]
MLEEVVGVIEAGSDGLVVGCKSQDQDERQEVVDGVERWAKFLFAPFSIVGLVLGHLVFISTTVTAAKGYAGAMINPARCFGPAVVRGGHLWDGHWIFWVGPTLASRKALASAELNQNGVNGVQRASSSEGMGIAEIFVPIADHWKWYEECGKEKINRFLLLRRGTEEYFNDFESHNKDIIWEDEQDGEAIELAFSKKKFEARKNWLRHFEPGTYLNQKEKLIKYSDFVYKELILFSMADLQRSIPSITSVFGHKTCHEVVRKSTPVQQNLVWVVKDGARVVEEGSKPEGNGVHLVLNTAGPIEDIVDVVVHSINNEGDILHYKEELVKGALSPDQLRVQSGAGAGGSGS